MSPLVPPLDPTPAPGPIWLFKLLLHATFFLHLLCMNLLLGGTLLVAVYGLKGKAKHIVAGGEIAKALPFAMAYAITFGVAPLLFIQVLYGPLFYSATIPLGLPVYAIVPLLLVAYYRVYRLSWGWDSLGARRPWIALVILGLLLLVGFIYSNAFTLMLDPERIYRKYMDHAGGGQLNLAEPSLLARFTHMVAGAIALSGLYVALRGLLKLRREPEQGRWQFRSGVTWFSGSVIIGAVTGIWWLLDLPREVMMTFMGGSPLATAAFGVGILSALATLPAVLVAINSLKPRPIFFSACGLALLALLCMIVMRDALRDATLRPYYDLGKLPVDPQWGIIAIFLLTFALGLGVVSWLLRLLLRPPSGLTNPPPAS